MSDLAGWIYNWIYKYYIYPIIYDTSYNPVDTVTWAVILGLSILGLLRLFRRYRFAVDERLVLATLPYILAGSSLRVVEDARLVDPPWSYLLITPVIFLVVFLVTIASLVLCRRIWGREYYLGYAATGSVWTVLNLIILFSKGMENAWVIVAVFFLGSLLTAGMIFLKRAMPQLGFLNGRFNIAIIYAHMLDASSTYFGVDWFDYYEKHVVPTYMIDLTGSAAIMFPLKLLILLPALYMIDSSLEDRSMRNLTKLALITLGLAPAIRNTLRLALGV